jgi:hypothetical protein
MLLITRTQTALSLRDALARPAVKIVDGRLWSWSQSRKNRFVSRLISAANILHCAKPALVLANIVLQRLVRTKLVCMRGSRICVMVRDDKRHDGVE